MRHRVGADLLGDLDLLLGDQRPRDRGAEQILSFVQRVRAEHREHVVAHEFLAQILDEDVLRLDAEQQRLLARRLELLALAEIGGEGHHLAAIGGLQPLQDDRGVEPARIGEHDFLRRFLGLAGHGAASAGPPWERALSGIVELRMAAAVKGRAGALFGYILIDVHIGAAGQDGAPALQEGAHHGVARHLVAVELQRGMGGVFDLDQDLGRVVDVLQDAEARPADASGRTARRCG